MTKIVSPVSGKEVGGIQNVGSSGSLQGEALKAHIAAYKLANPVKWAAKKAELEESIKNPKTSPEDKARATERLKAF